MAGKRVYVSYSWLDTESRVCKALGAAARFCPSVRAPFSVMCTTAVEEAA